MRAGVVLACLGVDVAVGVVAEFAEDPGGENRVEAGLAGVDLNVRVSAKMGAHHLAELVDLGVTGGWGPSERRRA